MKKIINKLEQVNKVYYKPDRTFTKELKSNVLSYAKNDKKSFFFDKKIKFVISFTQLAAFALIFALFFNSSAVDGREFIAMAKETNEKNIKKWIFYEEITEKFYPDGERLESTIKTKEYIFGRKYLISKQLDWSDKIYQYFDGYLMYSNNSDLDSNLYLTDYEVKTQLKEFGKTLDKEIELIIKKSFKDNKMVLSDIIVLKKLVKKYKERPNLNLMTMIRSEIDDLTVKIWLTKIEYEKYKKEKELNSSFNAISLWKKWGITHDKLLKYVESNIKDHYEIVDQNGTITFIINFGNANFEEVEIWKDDLLIKKMSSYKIKDGKKISLLIQEFNKVKYIDESEENNIFNPARLKLKLTRF